MKNYLPEPIRFLARAGKIGTLAAAAVGLSLSAQAQDEQKEERVVVTGSRISRIDVEGPSPVYTISRQDIENSGVTQISDLMRNLPYNSGVQEADAVASFAGDSAQFNLRGLGVNGTLILLNGRRIAPHAFSTSNGKNFVDLNSFPPSAIERIEILKDGASAVYGSDALAGVVNIILRNDFEGLEMNASYGNNTGGGDFGIATVSGALGITSGKGSLKVFTNYYKRNAIQLADRSYSANADQTARGGIDWTSGSSYPGIFRPAIPGTGLSSFVGNGTGVPFNYYNYNEEITGIPEAKRYGVTVIGDYMITDRITLFTELTYQRNWAWSQFAPAPSVNEFTVPANNPFNPTNPGNAGYYVPGLVDNTAFPDGIPLLIQFRPMDPGNRGFETTTQMTRALFGVKGEIGDGWNWEANYLYTASRVDDLTRNLMVKSAIQASLNSTNPATAINPFAYGVGQNNNQALYDAGKSPDSRTSTLDISQFSLTVTGELFDLPAGPVGVAFGAEYREEAIEDLPSAASSLGLLIGSGGTSSAGDRDGTALFSEVSVPVTNQLELKGALRWDDYSDFGDSTIFTVGASFRPTRDILLRTSYSEGFKAPSLPQAYGGQTVGFPPAVADRILVAATGISGFGTDRQFSSVTGGDPSLQPETSETFSIGFIIQPERMIPLLKGITLGVDWWKVSAENLISTRSSGAILLAEFNTYSADPAAFLAQNPATRAQTTRVLREPNTTYTDVNGNTITSVGRVDQVLSVYENIESVDIEGFDIELAFRRDFDFGRLDFRNTWVRLRDYDDGSGYGVGSWVLPKWRFNGSYAWTKGDYGVTFLVNYVGAYDEYYIDFFPGERVKAWTSYDLRLSYSGIANTKITLGIDNLFDKDPARVISDSSGFEGYYQSMIGRFVWASVSKKF